MRYKIIYLLLLVLSISTISCSKWLQNVPTDDRIMENELFSKSEGFLVALNGVYINLVSDGLYNGLLTYRGTDVMAQYWKTQSNSHRYYGLSQFMPAQKQIFSDNIWNSVYILLNNVNTIIEHCEKKKSSVLSDELYSLYKGEMLAMRALLHFELYRIYSPLDMNDIKTKMFPYSKSSEIKLRSLNTTIELREFILEDLYVAEKLLKQYDPVVKEGPNSSDATSGSNNLRYRNIRLNYYAVKSLIARASLFFGDMHNAYTYAKSVINETQIENEYFPFTSREIIQAANNTDQIFSSEIIFGAYNTRRYDDIYEKYFSPSISSDSLLIIPNEFVGSLYDDLTGDYRRTYQWRDETNASADRIICFVKMDRNKNWNSMEEMPNVKKQYYIPIIRISEMYFIIAESKYATNPTEAVEAISKIRVARNIDPFDSSSDLFKGIQEEVAREFVGEGQLFWFYKRHKLTEIPRISYVGETSAMDTDQYTFYIPKNEIDARN